MKLRDQIILVNVGIVAGLTMEASRGATNAPLLLTGVILFGLVNLFFWFRARKARQ